MTRAMIASGDTVAFGDLGGHTVDKHSTGASPMGSPRVRAARGSVGLAVAKLSGRGLGHTGGTLDKLGRCGLRTDAAGGSRRAVGDRVRGGRAVGGTCPPTGAMRLARRDRHGAVIPLTAASVMSKARGRRGLMLDVKAGSGAFMRTLRMPGRWRRRALALARGRTAAAATLPTCPSRSVTPSATRSTSWRPSRSFAGARGDASVNWPCGSSPARSSGWRGAGSTTRGIGRTPRSTTARRSSASVAWCRPRAGIPGWWTIPWRSFRARRSSCRSWRIAVASFRPSRRTGSPGERSARRRPAGAMVGRRRYRGAPEDRRRVEVGRRSVRPCPSARGRRRGRGARSPRCASRRARRPPPLVHAWMPDR